ncbi:hypothetical protein [Streptococcus suis]|uniref:hypothetical protein n=1 Tax=Streptococcus suis TaxID=1307 RepID=UPI0003F51D16|nr:hypothetical protein [Streptococcus suis]UUM58883.1 hypothetical protein NQZ91_11050 [Streptococcus suis]UUM63113.1 hypothetical protein NQZ89_11830 [Streptococcus suis]HEL1551530.1 hypothetical protein [Streptococcus suis]HEL2049148.1 hypothetical protein [Streptococcus suis]HEL2576566.1 hypothetical protein [Streptococcus suis]
MTKFEEMNSMNTNFVALTDQELMEMEGGSWPGEALVMAIFDIGKQTGRALRKLF